MGTHFDGLTHMLLPYRERSIATMSLFKFSTEGICLDFCHKRPSELIEADEIRASYTGADLRIQPRIRCCSTPTITVARLTPRSGQ